MKKIKEFLGNKNIIIIMCVIVIFGLSISLVISLNDDNNKTNTSNNTQTNIENEDENLSEEIKDEKKEDENKENKDDVNNNNNKPSNSSNSQKNENQTNNSSNNKKENTTQKPTTNDSSKKEDNNTNDNSLNTNKTYICPSGYTLSTDKTECYKVTELVKKYKCKEDYILNNDNTCTGIVRKPAEKDIRCNKDDFSGWENGSSEAYCYTDGYYKGAIMKQEDCSNYNYYVRNGSWSGCYNEKYNPTEIYYVCLGTWSKDPNDNKYCYKYETINSTEYYGCDDGYTLNSSKDSCLKIIASTIKE